MIPTFCLVEKVVQAQSQDLLSEAEQQQLLARLSRPSWEREVMRSSQAWPAPALARRWAEAVRAVPSRTRGARLSQMAEGVSSPGMVSVGEALCNLLQPSKLVLASDHDSK